MPADPVPPRGPRDLSTGLLRIGRLSLWLDLRSLWVGVRVDPEAIWLHLVPVLGLRLERRPGGPGQSQRVPYEAARPEAWLPGDWS